MTLLELVTEFCQRRGLDTPSAVMASSDQTVIQIKGLLNETLTNLLNRGTSWAVLQKQATFNSVADESQGTIASIAPYGFKYVIEDSLFDRTERRPLFGPRNAALWQESEALPQTGPFYSYRIWQGNFYLQPAPPADHVIAFEYASDYSILDKDGVTWKKRFTDDADVCQLNEDLLLYGLNWKWRREQGLSYAQEALDFEAFVAQAQGTEPTKGKLSMSNNTTGGIRPGVFVPSGNWNVN